MTGATLPPPDIMILPVDKGVTKPFLSSTPRPLVMFNWSTICGRREIFLTSDCTGSNEYST